MSESYLKGCTSDMETYPTVLCRTAVRSLSGTVSWERLKRQGFQMQTVSLRVIKLIVFHLFIHVSLGIWIP